MAPAAAEMDSPLLDSTGARPGIPGPANASVLAKFPLTRSPRNSAAPRGPAAAGEPQAPVESLQCRGSSTRQGRPCRGGVRTSVLSVVGLLALVAIVLVVLSRSLLPPEEAPSRARGTGEAPVVGTSPTPGSGDGPAITGSISVSAELAGSIPSEAVLFVIAHKGSGAPFAVRRIIGPRFPLRYRLGLEDVMMAGTPFEGEVRLSARISRTGSAGPAQSGDLEGERPAPVQVGALDADIVINRVR